MQLQLLLCVFYTRSIGFFCILCIHTYVLYNTSIKSCAMLYLICVYLCIYYSLYTHTNLDTLPIIYVSSFFFCVSWGGGKGMNKTMSHSAISFVIGDWKSYMHLHPWYFMICYLEAYIMISIVYVYSIVFGFIALVQVMKTYWRHLTRSRVYVQWTTLLASWGAIPMAC